MLRPIALLLLKLTMLMWSVTLVAAESRPLPEPLTLEAALELIDKQHPNLLLADSELQLAQSQLQQAQAGNDMTASLNAQLRWVDPPAIAPDQGNDDHQIGIRVRKTLYDFGRSENRIAAATQLVASQDYRYLSAQQRQYLEVMSRYFDVVLADLQYYRYNEEMAVAYIQYDRIRNRQKLGQYSELDVLEKQTEYQRIRRLRNHSQNQQRITRALLAQALNRPDNLPATVVRPKLDVMSRQLPEVEELQKLAKENNPALRALRARLQAAQDNIQVARAGSKPILKGAVEAYSYSRELGSHDNWRAGVTLEVPLWSGRNIDAAVAKAKADVYQLEAQLAQQEMQLQQQVLELWLKLDTLRVKHEEDAVGMEYREMYLDRSRAQYELEVRADLGDSMVRFSEAERKVMKTDFEISLTWAQLDALTGKLLQQHAAVPEKTPSVTN